MAEKELRDPKTGLLLEEEGIKEEGFFDFAEPYKQKLSEKLRTSGIPAGALAAEAIDTLIPSSPEGLAAKAGRVGGGLRSAIQGTFRARPVKEGERIFGRKSQDASAYSAMRSRDDVENSKRAAQEFLDSLDLKPPRKK